MHLNPSDARATVERRVDVHIFLFSFALDTRAEQGTEERHGKKERGSSERTSGGDWAREIEVDSKGEVGSLERKGAREG